MYWRIGSEYHKRPREQNKTEFQEIVRQWPLPGLLAFDGKTAVGWCQLTPRDDLPWLGRTRMLQQVDDLPVWSLSCFYVRRRYRRQGVMSALINAAVNEAKRAGAPALEAYPVDTDASKYSSKIFTGIVSSFRRAGFRLVVCRVPSRPLMRHDLKTIAG